MTIDNQLIAGIELGGTKTIALIARGTEILDEFRIPSTSPNEVLEPISNWLKNAREKYDFKAIGIASFGPVCLDKSSKQYGHITATPKPNWSNSDVVGSVKKWFDGPIGFDTDVNGAGLAEYYWGASQDCDTSIYVTIGTGLGGGIIANGVPLHGFMHPEMGHMRIRRNHQHDFKGVCPFHGDCIEGLVCGPAIKARTGKPAEELMKEDPIWEILADEIAEFLTNLIYVASPQKILIGGGVMQDKEYFFQKIRNNINDKLGNYINGLDFDALGEMIIPPKLGDKAGPLGAIALGLAALNN